MGWDLDIFLSHFYVKFGFLNFLERVMIQDNFSNGTELPLLVFNLFVKFFFFLNMTFPFSTFSGPFLSLSLLFLLCSILVPHLGASLRVEPCSGKQLWLSG